MVQEDDVYIYKGTMYFSLNSLEVGSVIKMSGVTGADKLEHRGVVAIQDLKDAVTLNCMADHKHIIPGTISLKEFSCKDKPAKIVQE